MVAALVETGVVMVQFLQAGLGFAPLGAGLRLLPGGGTLVLVAVSGRAVRRGHGQPDRRAPADRRRGWPLFAAGLSWARLTVPAALGSFC